MTKRTPEEAIWAETQTTLRPQMTRATYETIIEGTALISSANGVYKICTPTTMSKEWLENRLKSMVVRALANVVGQPITGIEFEAADKSVATVCPEIYSPVHSPGDVFKAQPSDTQPDEPATPASACATFARAVDFQSLWFEKGRSAGYTRVPDYAFQFWMLYLNNIKPKTFDLWFRIISDDKRNVHEPNFTYWTPVKQYSLKALGRAVGTLSTITVTGGPRSCWFNEQAKKLTGHPLAECCGKYQPVKWHQTEHGTLCCQHWQTGLLEVLYQEGLIAIEIIKPPPGKPRAHQTQLQAWSNIPLLTPHQVSQLSEVDQLRHAQWIERYGHLQGIDLARWEQLTDGRSLVPLLPDYDLRPATCPACSNGCDSACRCRCHKGRQLWGVYQPREEFFR